MAITHVGSSAWNDPVGGTSSYTLVKPTGVGLGSGDFMIAAVAADTFNNGNVTVNAPSGWTKIEERFASPYHKLCIMTRRAGSSEPSSWTGSFSANVAYPGSSIIAYRGVEPTGTGFTIEGSNFAGATTSLTSGTVNNTSTSNWRVTCGSCTALDSGSLTTTETSTRRTVTGHSFQLITADSNGGVATGNSSRKITRTVIWESAAIWIGLLDADEVNPPAPDPTTGTLSVTMPKVRASMSGSLGYTSTMAVTVPSLPTMTAAGISTPPEGPLAATVIPVMTVTAFTNSTGSVSINAGPTVNFFTETPRSGIRVINVEAESRTLTPKRGTDYLSEELQSLFAGLEPVGGNVMKAKMPLPRVSVSGTH